MTPRDRYFLAGIVLVYFVVNTLHGVTHFSIPVGLTAVQWTVILTVASAAPAVAIGLIWTGRTALGLPVFTLSMVGAFLFGLYYHFLVENPDNVGSVTGTLAVEFSVTAVLIAVSSFVGAAYGAWLWAVYAGVVGSGTDGEADRRDDE